jgi:hypothetical protein
MTFELYPRVALTCEIPDRNLRRGDVAILIDTVPDLDTGEDDYILEVFNAIGGMLDGAIMVLMAIVPCLPSPVLRSSQSPFSTPCSPPIPST